MTAAAFKNENRDIASIFSAIVPVADTIDLADLFASNPHCFAGVEFFADAQGAAPATPGAGTVTITIGTVNNGPLFEAAPDNVIDATAPTTVTWDGSTKAVRAVPAGVTTATHYRLIVTQHKT